MKTNWISVKKKLPNYRERVLVCVLGGQSTYRVGMGHRVSTDPTGEHWTNNLTNNPPVIAWMPLPEPLEDFKTTNNKTTEL